MAPAMRRRAANGGSRQAAAAADGDDDDAAKRRRRATTTTTTTTTTSSTPTTTPPTATFLSAAEAADARELEELGGIDPATSFLYTPHTLTGLVIGIALLIYYTGALSGYIGEIIPSNENEDDPSVGRRRGLLAALAAWLLYCLLQGSPRMPLLRPHPAVWRLVHGAAVAYLLSLVWLLCQTAEGARVALAVLHPELGKPLPERSYGGDCGLLRKKTTAAASDGSFFSSLFSLSSSSFNYELNLSALKSTLLDEFVVAHALGWWAKAILLRDRRLLWPLSVGFELAEGALAHALPNFNECWWDRWVLDVALCNFVGMELGMATAALLRSREKKRRGVVALELRSGGGSDDGWGGVSTKRGALAKAGRVAAQFSPRSWEERDWDPRGSARRALWALFLVGAFLLFDLNSFFLKAALWVPQLNPLTLYRLSGFFLLGLPAFKEFYRFVVAGEERAAAEEARRRKKLSEEELSLLPPVPANSNRLGPCAWLMLAIIATETLVAVKFGPRLLGGGDGGKEEDDNLLLPPSAKRAVATFVVAAVGLAASWLWSGVREQRRRSRGG